MDGKMIKIAISGQAKTGKNTLAEMIVSYLNPGDKDEAMIVAVADPIKRMVMEMCPDAEPKCLWGESELRSHHLPGNLKDAEGNRLTYRRLLTDIGKAGRLYNEDIWLSALVQFSKKTPNLRAFIISDCRFPNEIKYFKENDFYSIRLKRTDTPQIDDVSETAQLSIPDSYFDQVIDNNFALNDLKSIAKSIIHKLAY